MKIEEKQDGTYFRGDINEHWEKFSKYNQLKKVIIKAVPEIRKKEIGCKIYKPNYWENTKDKNLYGVIVGINKTMNKLEADDIVYVRYYCEGSYAHTYNVYDFSEKHPEGLKIIGRPISLEDCLIAIGKDKDGCFPKISLWDNEIQIGRIEDNCNWKMGKSLENQSEETIFCLHNLIFNK